MVCPPNCESYEPPLHQVLEDRPVNGNSFCYGTMKDIHTSRIGPKTGFAAALEMSTSIDPYSFNVCNH